MMKHVLISATLALVLAGCSTTTPAINEYTIIPLYSPQNPVSTPTSLSLKLTQTKSIVSLASKELYYLRDSTQTGAYLYSRWSDTPASMIDRSLFSSLQNRHLFATLLPATSSAYADMTLESDLHAFYHRFKGENSSEGFIDITYRLIDFKNKKTIASKRFVITEPSKSANAAGGANALSVATHRLNQESTLWLETILKL
ncbi:MAG: ABC-type transport auxiliary lipoprotein family protein [Sulfuricurvum sp.]|nr:ABC-type transport auxiliary lipoprotein family protein [Sulfuricurvum sp.]